MAMTPGPGFERSEVERALTPDEMARLACRERQVHAGLRAEEERLLYGNANLGASARGLGLGLPDPDLTQKPQRQSEIAAWSISLSHTLERLEKSIAALAERLAPVLDTSPRGSAGTGTPAEGPKSQLGQVLRDYTFHAERLADLVEELASRLEV